MADTQQYFEAVGRRKESTARARVYPGGAGNIKVNDREHTEYFGRAADVAMITAPLSVTEAQSKFTVSIHVVGGGITGQATASRMALARALVTADPELRAALKAAGYLSRDAREKERKKPGLKRARKAPTYTKR